MAFRKIKCLKINRDDNDEPKTNSTVFTKEEKNKNNSIDDSDEDDFNLFQYFSEMDLENDKREKKEILIEGTKNRYAIKNQAPINLPVIEMPRKIVIETMSKLENLTQEQLSKSDQTNTSMLFSSSFMNSVNMFDYNFQLQMIDEMINDELGIETKQNIRYNEIKSIFKREVKKKISSYRQQDILKDYKKNKEKKKNQNKNKNPILSICKVGWIKEETEEDDCKDELNDVLQNTKEEKKEKKQILSNHKLTYLNVLQLMKEQENKCYYCHQKCFLFYAHKREMNQWTLDRINNEMDHVVGNLIIACLECNIVRRRRSMQKFSESKHIQHHLKLVNHNDSPLEDEKEQKEDNTLR